MTLHSSHQFSKPDSDQPRGSVQAEVSAIQSAVEDVTQNYLETLDALSTVYEVAAGFAQLFDTSSIAYFTLRRILESLDQDCGAIYLEVGGELKFHVDSESAREHLREDAIEDASLSGQALFCNDSDAIRYLRPEAGSRNVLVAPIVAAQRRLGIVVVSADGTRTFTTKDLKLVSAVTSQSAIALSSAQHLEQILVERQKLRSVIEDNGGGIIVLAPDGRTMLTNVVARTLLGLDKDRAEGFSLVDELADWKFSREPESLRGEGPSELSLEMADSSGPQERVISVVGRRVRGKEGDLASIVLNLQDVSDQRRDEKTKDDLLLLICKAFRTPIETLRGRLGSSTGAAEESCAGESESLKTDVEELEQLADVLQRYVEVLDDSWEGRGIADLEQAYAEASLTIFAAHAGLASHLEVNFDSTALKVGTSAESVRLIFESLLGIAAMESEAAQSSVRITSLRVPSGAVELRFEGCLSELPSELRRAAKLALTEGREGFSVGEADLGVRLALVEEAARRGGGTVDARRTPGGLTLLSVTLPAPARD